jgi:phenylacetate-coenzyme A ligase PaaK-like adenylate-forming protein
MHDKGMLIEKKCSCGRTFSLMKPHAGRSSEYIMLPTNEILSPYLFTTNIEKIDGLLQYQIVQTEKKQIVVRVTASPDNFNNIAAQIRKILSAITSHLVEIEIIRDENINNEVNGKFKVVKNLLTENNGI